MKLHTHGLLRNSFRPSQEIRTMRTCWRQRNDLVHIRTSGLCGGAPLIPHRDVEADGFRRDIHANVMFAPWLDRKPCRHIRASEIIHLRCLVSRPIRGN